MPSRYHPIEDGLWNDEKFDACSGMPDAPFLERAFFAWLCSNERQRPAGIYRATDDQLASDTRLSSSQVTDMLSSLDTRSLIVRDGSWIFVKKYFKRLPKHSFLLKSAQKHVEGCSSVRILNAFSECYPMFNQWSANRLAMVEQPSLLRSRVELPTKERKGEERKGKEKEIGGEAKTVEGLPEWFSTCLKDSPNFFCLLDSKYSAFWKTMSAAYDPYEWLKWDEQILKADAWIEANPQRRPRQRTRFLKNWFERAVEHGRIQHAKEARAERAPDGPAWKPL